ncbi:N-acetylmuramoyl-L-alanine amidase [Altericista sp. CCNU0014]|uniref:N-acetylmuramoyl-L-alanine amidase n=1 Tax=Altericista sp. CCNU0014 TaxID=3082949 RepID=UPI00384ACFC0
MKSWIVTVLGAAMLTQPAFAQSALKVVYPPTDLETTSARIFLIGTAPANAVVTVNGQIVRDRSPSGHFSPSISLQVGSNTITVKAQEQTLTLVVKRLSVAPPAPKGFAFAEGSLTPAVDIARQPGEPICFGAIAPAKAQVTVRLGRQAVALYPQPRAVTLPPNSAVLTAENSPSPMLQGTAARAELYQGCTVLSGSGELGTPLFELRRGKTAIVRRGIGKIAILPPQILPVTEVTGDPGTARTGPSTDYSRLTPLPKGTQALVTGREGEWLRLDYGGWIKQSETRPIVNGALPRSIVRSVRVQTQADRTNVIFPLQVPVPVAVKQADGTFTLTLYNTTAQTDTIAQTPGPVLSRLDWQQVTPGQVQYQLHLKNQQQWGYQLRYEGTSLVLSLRHPPPFASTAAPLAGTTILLDPGHGSANDKGSVGPTGYPEKDAVLVVSNLLRRALERQGAKVVATREGDEDLYPNDRVKKIEQVVPTLAISLHYNALPDGGDAWNTKGVSTFWYHPQAQGLAVFLHDHLVQKMGRPSYGVYWNNLALTRPAIAPSILLELGFMINPNEFEWITDPDAQQQLAKTLAEGIALWVQKNRL